MSRGQLPATTVVIFGAGPIGIFAAKSAWLMGAGRVIVVDHIEYRLDFVRRNDRRGNANKKSAKPLKDNWE